MVMLIDLDNFKALNDTYGHKAGDQALVHAARTLSATADPQAVIARIGGEEFLLATTAPPACTAESLATQLCTAIAVTPAAVTASIGAVCTRLDGNTAAAGHDVLLEKTRRGRRCGDVFSKNAPAATRSITPPTTTRTPNSAPFGAPETGTDRLRISSRYETPLPPSHADGRRAEHKPPSWIIRWSFYRCPPGERADALDPALQAR